MNIPENLQAVAFFHIYPYANPELPKVILFLITKKPNRCSTILPQFCDCLFLDDKVMYTYPHTH